MMFKRQIKGIIAIFVILVFIPFISFLYPSQIDSKCPILSTASSDTLIIEVVAEDGGMSGVFFVEPGTTAGQLLSRLDSKRISAEDFKLQTGMKIRLVPEGDHQGIVIEKMEATKRLALGLPLDINLVGHDELMLIPGVGDVLAANIMTWRDKIGRFEKLDQLMDIKGIKKKKLSKLSKYLYVDK
jgi:hypothetical protein